MNRKYRTRMKLVMDMAVAEVLNDFIHIESWTVDDWVEYGTIETKYLKYTNAIKAKEILNSSLYKELKEDNDTITDSEED